MSDNLSDTWMWERARNLIDQAERLQKSFGTPGAPGAGSAGWAPPVDIFETKTEWAYEYPHDRMGESDEERHPHQRGRFRGTTLPGGPIQGTGPRPSGAY